MAFNTPTIKRKAVISKVNAGDQLVPTVSFNDQKVNSIGTVAKLANGRVRKNILKNITVVLDNTAGESSVNYILNDYTGVIAFANGVTASSPTSASVTPAIMEKVLNVAPIEIKAINYQVEVSQSQFSEAFEVLSGDIDKSRDVLILDPSAYKRNNAFDSKLLTLEFEEPIKLSWDQSIFMTVQAGEKVTLTLTPSAAANR